MNSTEQEPVPKPPMTDEERRQRRINRILNSSEARMEKILGHGGERRLAPAMEGGDPFSLNTFANSSTQSTATKVQTSNEFLDCIESFGPEFSCILGMLFRLIAANFISLDFNILLPWIIFAITLEVFVMLPYRSRNNQQNIAEMIPPQFAAMLNSGHQKLPFSPSTIANTVKVANSVFQYTRNFIVGYVIGHTLSILGHMFYRGVIHVLNN